MNKPYTYFHDALQQWLSEAGSDQSAERMRALRRVLDRRMHLVSIELEASEDPQAIFETLNARRVPLLASDLLRNYIFQRAGKPEAAQKLHEQYWVCFETADDETVPEGPRFWEVEVRQHDAIHHAQASKPHHCLIIGRWLAAARYASCVCTVGTAFALAGCARAWL